MYLLYIDGIFAFVGRQLSDCFCEHLFPDKTMNLETEV